MSDVKNLVAYVAGPYRAPSISGIRANIEAAREIGEWLWERGIPALVPHLNTAFMDGVCPDAYFLAGDLIMLRRCDFLVALENWEQSSGARAEVAEMRRLGRPVFFMPDGTCAILQFAANAA